MSQWGTRIIAAMTREQRLPWLVACGVVAWAAAVTMPQAQVVTPATTNAARVDATRLAKIDEVVAEAIAEKKLPGAVVLVGQGDAVVFRKAYGHRALVPAPEVMTLDTMFDMASLTKVIATTSAVMMLVEAGKIRLSDPVAQFIPDFAKYGKDRVTVRHLLTHMSGLRPDVDLADPWVGYEAAMALANEEVLGAAPGRQFVYSDIGFFLLADIVAKVSGQPFDQFVATRLFQPLGMTDTMFNPAAVLRDRIAPTESCTQYGWPCAGPGAEMLRGTVHDPTARRMGGVAGHAGLFSTADDTARFARMLLRGGELDGARVLSPLAVARMTSPSTPDGLPSVRGLGWDLDSSYSSNRGELLPIGSFGHTGFTGTSLWVDPATQVFVVFMSNRVHPEGKGDVTPLRARVATIAASAFSALPATGLAGTRRTFESQTPAVPAPTNAPVQNGIDVLRAGGFAALKGLRVGLLTNHTGRARDGAATIDVLAAAPDVKLTALFSPEHGIRGILDAVVPSTHDAKTDLPIHSLYGDSRRPTDAMLAGLDAIVIDLQDVGARFYTYMTTMAYVMEEAASRKIKVFVLDRPNPIGGVHIEGPVLDPDAVSFIGYLPAMPTRHGMTLGELARLFNAEKKIGADLTVVAMRNWRRDAWFDDTGLMWIGPSPNMRNLYAATLYTGLASFESANLSVGRGTDTPFEHIGAPWIDGVRLAEALNARAIPGVRFYPEQFTPNASKFANELCQGVFIVVTDRNAVRPVRVGVEIASALLRLFPGKFEIDSSLRLFGSASGLARLKSGDDPAAIAATWSGGEARWRLLRAKYLLY